jgi:hypothetical protein
LLAVPPSSSRRASGRDPEVCLLFGLCEELDPG